jgi:hypothetical protein
MALGTPLSNYKANKRLMVLVRDDFRHLDGPHDAALYAWHLRRERRARGGGRYPGPGNSETIMRNQVLRAKSFGLEHDGRY